MEVKGVAGCWVHAKRKYAELVKSTGIPKLEGTIAAQGVKLISELFHLDGLYGKSGGQKPERLSSSGTLPES